MNADFTAYWLPVTSAAVVAGAVALYVVLDGFDLGLGILFPFFAQEADRDRMGANRVERHGDVELVHS